MTVASPTTIDPLKHFAAGAFTAGSRHPIPLIATRFDVEIDGGIAVVTTLRRFRNDEAESIEATITFPMPVHAVLFDLEARIGERVLKARAQARGTAREAYEDAIERGKTSVLHEEVLRGVHMLSIAHIAPGDTIEVVTRWAAVLSFVADEGRLRIPLTVGDIYGCSPLPDSDALIHGGPVQSAALTVRCADGTLTVQGHLLENGTAEITLDAPIDLAVRGAPPRELTGRAADGRAVSLLVEPNAVATGTLDVAILVDHSGSMNEACATPRGMTKHHAVIAGLRALAGRLRPTDSVDLWEFANQPRHIGLAGDHPRAPRWPAPAQKLQRGPLSELISGLSTPAGGTEIGIALSSVIVHSKARDILLITDGKSYAVDVQALARMGRRVTVVLIGEDSLEANVGHLAALTGGDILVATNDRIAELLLAAIDGLRANPTGTDEPGYPRRIRTTRGHARIKAEWGPVTDSADKADPSGLSRAVAALSTSLALPTLETMAAKRLAETEGLVTHLTSLVLVDEDAKVQAGLPATRKIALATPRTMALYAAAAPLPSPPVGAAPRAPMTGAPMTAAPMMSSSAPRPAAPSASPASPEGSGVRFLRREMSQGPSFALDLSHLSAAIDWNSEGNKLVAGDLSGLDRTARNLIEQAATLDVVKRAADRCQVQPVLLVLALLAWAVDSDRNARRVRRAILNGRSSRAMDDAAKALNLSGRNGFLRRLLAR